MIDFLFVPKLNFSRRRKNCCMQSRNFTEVLFEGSHWCWNLQPAETPLKRSSVTLCRAGTRRVTEAHNSEKSESVRIWNEIWCHTFFNTKNKIKGVEAAPAVRRFRPFLSVLLSVSVWNDSFKNTLFAKLQDSCAACLDSCCPARVLGPCISTAEEVKAN